MEGPKRRSFPPHACRIANRLFRLLRNAGRAQARERQALVQHGRSGRFTLVDGLGHRFSVVQGASF